MPPPRGMEGVSCPRCWIVLVVVCIVSSGTRTGVSAYRYCPSSQEAKNTRYLVPADCVEPASVLTCNSTFTTCLSGLEGDGSSEKCRLVVTRCVNSFVQCVNDQLLRSAAASGWCRWAVQTKLAVLAAVGVDDNKAAYNQTEVASSCRTISCRSLGALGCPVATTTTTIDGVCLTGPQVTTTTTPPPNTTTRAPTTTEVYTWAPPTTAVPPTEPIDMSNMTLAPAEQMIFTVKVRNVASDPFNEATFYEDLSLVLGLQQGELVMTVLTDNFTVGFTIPVAFQFRGTRVAQLQDAVERLSIDQKKTIGIMSLEAASAEGDVTGTSFFVRNRSLVWVAGAAFLGFVLLVAIGFRLKSSRARRRRVAEEGRRRMEEDFGGFGSEGLLQPPTSQTEKELPVLSSAGQQKRGRPSRDHRLSVL